MSYEPDRTSMDPGAGDEHVEPLPLSAQSYRELQLLAKRAGIPATQPRRDLEDQISNHQLKRDLARIASLLASAAERARADGS